MYDSAYMFKCVGSKKVNNLYKVDTGNNTSKTSAPWIFTVRLVSYFRTIGIEYSSRQQLKFTITYSNHI